MNKTVFLFVIQLVNKRRFEIRYTGCFIWKMKSLERSREEENDGYAIVFGFHTWLSRQWMERCDIPYPVYTGAMKDPWETISHSTFDRARQLNTVKQLDSLFKDCFNPFKRDNTENVSLFSFYLLDFPLANNNNWTKKPGDKKKNLTARIWMVPVFSDAWENVIKIEKNNVHFHMQPWKCNGINDISHNIHISIRCSSVISSGAIVSPIHHLFPEIPLLNLLLLIFIAVNDENNPGAWP